MLSAQREENINLWKRKCNKCNYLNTDRMLSVRLHYRINRKVRELLKMFECIVDIEISKYIQTHIISSVFCNSKG